MSGNAIFKNNSVVGICETHFTDVRKRDFLKTILLSVAVKRVLQMCAKPCPETLFFKNNSVVGSCETRFTDVR